MHTVGAVNNHFINYSPENTPIVASDPNRIRLREGLNASVTHLGKIEAQALIHMVEGIKRSPISLRTREIVQSVGLTMVLMLMGLAFWNDLSRHWNKFVEWLTPGL